MRQPKKRIGPAAMAKPMCNLTGHSDRLTAHRSPAVQIAGRAAAPVAYADIAPQLGWLGHTLNLRGTKSKKCSNPSQPCRAVGTALR